MYDRREDMHGRQPQKVKAFAESRLYRQAICPVSIDGFLRMPIINVLLTGHAHASVAPTRVHTAATSLQTSLADVIFPITRIEWLLGFYSVGRVAYTASCRMPPRDRLPTRHAHASVAPTRVHTGLRCGKLPWRKPSSRKRGTAGSRLWRMGRYRISECDIRLRMSANTVTAVCTTVGRACPESGHKEWHPARMRYRQLRHPPAYAPKNMASLLEFLLSCCRYMGLNRYLINIRLFCLLIKYVIQVQTDSNVVATRDFARAVVL